MKKIDTIWTSTIGDGPLIATAIHNGHAVRDEVESLLALSDAERLREEDPFTEAFTHVATTRIVGLRSRFEVDLNRPRDGAVYVKPEDAWGLHVWKETPPDEVIQRSLREYDAFYTEMKRLFDDIHRRHGRFVVFDIHSYNHRRGGADAEPDDPESNPEINIGTGMLDRERWGSLVDRFMKDMRSAGDRGRPLDVRENVKFKGGYFPRWIHENFGSDACALAIEFRKDFMNEWTGEPDNASIHALREALAATVPGVLEEVRG
jgi:N-formylglutamate amidohydrolase